MNAQMGAQDDLRLPPEEREELRQIREENGRLQQELETLHTRHQSELARLRLEGAATSALLERGARDPRTVLPLLKLDELQLEDGALRGLDEQLAPLREAQGYLFRAGEAPRIDSGCPHGRAPGESAPATLAGALQERYR